MPSPSTRTAVLEVRPPALGAARVPGPRLHAFQRSAVDLVAMAMELRPALGPDTLAVAAALADTVVNLVREIVGHDLGGYRSLFAEAAHFGGLVAVAEEHQVHSARGRVAPHVVELLACVGAEFVEDDKLAEELCRWLLESGYFLVRTGTPTAPLVDSLRVDLTRLLAEVEDDELADELLELALLDDETSVEETAVEESDDAPAPVEPPRLPRPTVSPESRAAEASAGS